MGFLSGKCLFCGKSGQSRTKAGDWLCGNCLKDIGGMAKWFDIRKMSKDEIMALKKTPIKTKILDHGGGAVSIKSGGLGRAAIGGALFGGAGAIVGAGTGKRGIDRNDYTVFKVWFNDGSDEIQKIPHNSELYERYLALLED